MDLLSYFGKLIPIGEKVTITGYQFNYMMTLGIAACVIFLGHWMVRHSKFLQKYCIPAPVVAGLVVSIILSIVRGMPACHSRAAAPTFYRKRAPRTSRPERGKPSSPIKFNNRDKKGIFCTAVRGRRQR